MMSPVFTNIGTWTTAPVSSVALLVVLPAEFPFSPGGVSVTFRSALIGQTMLMTFSFHIMALTSVFCLVNLAGRPAASSVREKRLLGSFISQNQYCPRFWY